MDRDVYWSTFLNSFNKLKRPVEKRRHFIYIINGNIQTTLLNLLPKVVQTMYFLGIIYSQDITPSTTEFIDLTFRIWRFEIFKCKSVIMFSNVISSIFLNPEDPSLIIQKENKIEWLYTFYFDLDFYEFSLL